MSGRCDQPDFEKSADTNLAYLPREKLPMVETCAALGQPNFRAKLGGIVDMESLVKLSCQIRDGSELYAERIRDRRLWLAQRELNPDL